MSQFSEHIQIDVPREQVWETLSDLESVETWNPNVSKARYTSPNREGIGASRHCDLVPKGYLEESVVEWKPGLLIGISIDEGTPMKKAVGRFQLNGSGSHTEVTMSVEYEMGLGPLGPVMDRLVVRRQYPKAARQLLASLKSYLETGEAAKLAA